MIPYERLLGDALWGGTRLLVREDGVEAGWRVGDPILRNVTPVHEYESNSWGPTEADQISAGHGGWRNPQPAIDKVPGTTKRNPGGGKQQANSAE